MQRPLTGVAVGIAALVVSFAIGGPKAAGGMGLGILATLFSLIALSWVVGIVARPLSEPAEARGRTAFIIFCFLLKVPLLGAAWWLSQRLGDPAPGHFIAGLFLVYLALVGWAIARSEPA
jgi:hypothetical protein